MHESTAHHRVHRAVMVAPRPPHPQFVARMIALGLRLHSERPQQSNLSE